MRYARVGERVAFATGRRRIVGEVVTFRLIAEGAGERQELTVRADDGEIHIGVDAAVCTLVARRARAEEGRPDEGAERPVDVLAVAARAAASDWQAVRVSVRETRALAQALLDLHGALERRAAEKEREERNG